MYCPEYTGKEVMRNEERVDEIINEGVLRWFDYVERTKKNRIAKRVYVRECGSSRSVGRQRKK